MIIFSISWDVLLVEVFRSWKTLLSLGFVPDILGGYTSIHQPPVASRGQSLLLHL